MNTIVEYEGWFFLPSDTSKQVAGIITYDPSDSIKLRLIGSFPGVGFGYFSSEVIWGSIDNGKAVTLYKPIEIRRDNALSTSHSKSTFISEFMIIGGLFKNKKDLNFTSIDVYFKYLSEWFFSPHMINYERQSDTGNITVSSESMPKRAVSLSKGYELSVNTFRSIPNINYYYNHATLNLDAFLKLKSSRKKSLQEFLRDVFHFQYFLTICTQRYCDIDKIEGIFKITNKPQFMTAKIYFIAHRFSYRYKNIKGPEDLLVPYSVVNSYFETLMQKWFDHKYLLEKSLDSFLSIYQEPDSYNPNKFLLLTKAMESFHRSLRKKNMVQVDRYKELFEEGRLAFNPFLKIRSRSRFCEKVKDLRNEFAHNLDITFSQFYRNKDLYKITEQLKVIFACVLLKEIGLSITEIRNLVDQNSFGEI